jgi:hypothetical protein
MNDLRRIPFLIGLGALVLVIAVEVGAAAVRPPPPPDPAAFRRAIAGQDADPRPDVDALARARKGQDEPPGLGVPALALLDGLLLLTIGLMGASLIVPPRVMGRIQAPIRLIIAILLLLAVVMALIKAVTLLLVMFGLFVAAPFGTIAYIAVWGFFDRGDAAVALSVIMFLKVVLVIGLVLAQQDFLRGKALVLLILTSLLGSLVVTFLHGLVPGILVSITDALAAIIVAILALIWALVIAIGAIVPTIKSLRLESESS